MAKAPLTATFCRDAFCPPNRKKVDFWDNANGVSGFVLECRISGGKTYYLRYFDQTGRQRQHKIGKHSDISFDQARKAARRLRSEVVLGGDPSADKEEKKAIPTYAALSVQHLSHAKTYMRSYDSLEANMRLHIVPKFGRLKLNEITPQAVAQWLAELHSEGMAPATIEKLRVSMGKSYSLASAWSVPGADKNPVRGVKGPAFDNRETGRFISPVEAGRLLKAAGNSLNVQLRPIVSLLLLTGCRVGELVRAKWDDVDLERRAWRIPMSKNGKSRHVPLSQAAVEVIKALPKYDKCPWLVPNPETKLPFVSFKHSWQKARKDAGLSTLRVHDLRHSAAGLLVNSGVDLYTVAEILGHSDLKSAKRYSRLENSTLLSAVEAGASKLSEQWG